MQKILLEKMTTQNLSFTDEETQWLMANIGHENPDIRDALVFNLLATGLIEGRFTKEQFDFLTHTTISNNLLFYQINNPLPATLTRSFTALLNGFIIQVDSLTTSPYYHRLTQADRDYFFHSAIQYLYEEFDRTGYSETYGWVHAFAHGADFLSKVVSHDLFPKQRVTDVFDCLTFIIQETDMPFKDNEDRRLAHIIYKGLTHHTMSQQQVTCWIESMVFPLEVTADFYRLKTFEDMLVYIYFHSLDNISLEDDLKNAILAYLKKY